MLLPAPVKTAEICRIFILLLLFLLRFAVILARDHHGQQNHDQVFISTCALNISGNLDSGRIVANLFPIPPVCHVFFYSSVISRPVAYSKRAHISVTIKARAYLLWILKNGGTILTPVNSLWVSTTPPLAASESIHKIRHERLWMAFWVTFSTPELFYSEVLNLIASIVPPSCFLTRICRAPSFRNTSRD